jgi:hypothetical protein
MSHLVSVRFGVVGLIALGALALIAGTSVSAAQTTTPPSMPTPIMVAQSADFATVRSRFENLTAADLAQDGYQIEPVCVTAAMAGAPAQFGNMGFHGIQPTLIRVQFGNGRPDPEQPPIVLLDASQRVVGLEWESNQRAPAPVLFGQTVSLLPGHPGLEEPHYMLHAYFRPDSQVLFAVFDPQLACPAPGVSRDGSSLDAQPADTRALFGVVWGAAASERWAFERNVDLTRAGR